MTTQTNDVHLGLCCLNTHLRKQKPPVFNSRTCIRKTYTVDKAKDLALKNIVDISKMLEYNKEHDIHCFRLSSNIFPHFTDYEVESYDINFAHDALKEAGDLAREYGQRLLMHPGQFNQIGAPDRDVFQRTVDDLSHHADILDAMGVDNNGVLIIHGGGRYGDKDATITRWVKQYFELPDNVRRRIVLENCERGYSIDDVLYIHDLVKDSGGDLPVVFDSHHYECWEEIYPDDPQTNLEDVLPEVVDTWGNRRVVMHVSNQGDGKIGHHSDFIYDFPDCFSHLHHDLGLGFDLEVEAKKKEQAIFALREKYSWLK